MIELRIGVGDLAHFIHRRGDLHQHFDDPTTAIEGSTGHRIHQTKIKETDSRYETEVSVSRTHSWDEFQLKVEGRIDGLIRKSSDFVLVEEIKATRALHEELKTNVGSTHVAQAKLYAAMLQSEVKKNTTVVRLTYINPDTQNPISQDSEYTEHELNEFFESTCNKYLAWIKKARTRVAARNVQAEHQNFPFDTYNDGQYSAARHIYRALRDRDHFLWEAATGTGKTISSLYPAVKAMGSDQIDRIVFVTARNTGQRIVRQNLDLLHKHNSALTFVNISAKQEMCFFEGMPCDPESCEYAKGYYDRMWDARETLLERRAIDKQTINAVARSAKVCPFELSLDAAEWADVVIGDYNYVFDPRVGLQRLHSKLFSRVTVLIDEAHRLTGRVCEMLSCSITIEAIDEAIAVATNHVAIRALDRVRRFIHTLREEFLQSSGEIEVMNSMGRFWSSVDSVLEALDRLPNKEFSNELVLKCIYELVGFQSAKDRVNDDDYMWVLTRTDDTTELSLRCLLPGSWISSILKRYHSSVRFSGTLSPADLINEAHGVEGAVHITQSLSDEARFGVFVVPDISTYYRDRQTTANQIVELLSNIQAQALGNWLVAFPSFEYMQLIFNLMADEEEVFMQEREMSREEREEYIEKLTRYGNKLAFCVMGGVFTESIDFDSDTLTGVVVIGPGIPPKSVAREKVKTNHNDGFELAYRQPAMTRVIQAAGRVVRGESDRGMVILIDPRFTQPKYIEYFPGHWNPSVCKSNELPRAIREFWQGESQLN